MKFVLLPSTSMAEQMENGESEAVKTSITALADVVIPHGHGLIGNMLTLFQVSNSDEDIEDAEVIIIVEWNTFLPSDLIEKAKNLKLCVAGRYNSGQSFNIDTAMQRGIEIIQVPAIPDVDSLARNVVMTTLLYTTTIKLEFEGEVPAIDFTDLVKKSDGLKGKVVGTIGAGRIGYRVLQGFSSYGCKELLYYDQIGLPDDVAKAVNAQRIEDLKEFVSRCDIVTINLPLLKQTAGLINADVLEHFKKGAYIVNTSEGAICDTDAIRSAQENGNIVYIGMPWTTEEIEDADPQVTFFDGVRSIVDKYLKNEPHDPRNIILGSGKYNIEGAWGETQIK